MVGTALGHYQIQSVLGIEGIGKVIYSPLAGITVVLNWIEELKQRIPLRR